MTAACALQVAWARKGWIAAPLAISTGVAAVVGWGLSGRVSYGASCLVAVSEGAHAQAVFACRSLDVLEAVLDAPEFKDTRRRYAAAAGLAEEVTVTVLGEGRLMLDVEAPSAPEAERLAAGIVAEADRSVRTLSEKARREDEGRIRELEDRCDLARRNVDALRSELGDLMARHRFDTGPLGELVSNSRARLAAIRAKEAELAARLSGIEAELDVLGAKDAHAAASLPPGVEAARGRLLALDAEIARLREDLTDADPRLVKLVAERFMVVAGLERLGDSADPSPGETQTGDAGNEMRVKESERARVSAMLAATRKERAGLAEFVRVEAANAEGRARGLSRRMASARAEAARAERLLEEQRVAADRNRAAGPALRVVESGKARPVRGGASVGWLSLAGAALGLMIGGLTAALVEALGPAIRSVDDVARRLDLPVLATVPSLSDGREGTRWAGATAWLAAFLLAAVFLVTLVYPGWGRLKAAFAGPGARAGAEEARR